MGCGASSESGPTPVGVDSHARGGSSGRGTGSVVLPEGKKHAVFITHDWGNGEMEELGRDNHARAAALNRALRAAGVPTWFDEEKMEGQVDVAMANGLEECALVLLCVTQRYMEKVKGDNQTDNCWTEFSYALRLHTPTNMLCVVMEPRMKRTQWNGILGMKLGGALYADFTDDSKLEAVVRGAQINILGWIDGKLGSDFKSPAEAPPSQPPSPRPPSPQSEATIRGHDENTELFNAARDGNVEEVRRLVGIPGVDVNLANRSGCAPLYAASEEGCAEAVRLLLGAPGIEVNLADKYGKTPLAVASEKGHTEVVKLLLEAPGVDVTRVDSWGRTALHVASKEGGPEVVKLLLQAPGIDIRRENKKGKTALDVAKTREIQAILQAAWDQ